MASWYTYKAMIGCDCSIVPVALFNFNLQVPKVSVLCGEYCRLFQSEELFVQARVGEGNANQCGVQPTFVDAKALWSSLLGGKEQTE